MESIINSNESITKLTNSLNQTHQLKFKIQNSLSSSVLSFKDQFEQTYLREAESNEINLFQIDNHQPTVYQIGLESTHQQLFNLSKQSNSNPQTGDLAFTKSILMTMQSLLEIHPMPRLQEHLIDLIRQLDTLEQSIAALQHQLKLPPTAPLLPTKSRFKIKSKPLAKIKEAIQRESLEILALTDLRDEQRAKSRQLAEQITQMEMISNSPKKRKTPKKPIPSNSTFTDSHDPFLSRTELTRRIIQRAKSPKIHSSSQTAGVSDHEDDHHHHMLNTPTPQTTTQKRLQQSLTKLKNRTPFDPKPQPSLQLSDSLKKPQELLSGSPLIVPKPEPCKDSIDHQSYPSHSPLKETQKLIEMSSPASKPMIIASTPSLPESRLAVLSRLTNSFWRSNTLLDSLKLANPELQTALHTAGGTLNSQQTTEALDQLIKSYPTKVDMTLSPNKLIEASFYYELFKTFSQTEEDENSLHIIFHQEDWCVSLEEMKIKLIKVCEENSISISINTTVIYLLVGKMVIKIDRRANPILICVC